MQTTLKPPDIGSISHGTLRSEDLLDTYTSELGWQIRRNGDYYSANHDERDAINAILESANEECYDDDGEYVEDSDVIDWHLEQLSDALETFAGPYCYFGAHYGDGSDFGFWPSYDAIEELPAISDNSLEAIQEHEGDVRYVNDHGNVTVYSHSGEVIIDLV